MCCGRHPHKPCQTCVGTSFSQLVSLFNYNHTFLKVLSPFPNYDSISEWGQFLFLTTSTALNLTLSIEGNHTTNARWWWWQGGGGPERCPRRKSVSFPDTAVTTRSRALSCGWKTGVQCILNWARVPSLLIGSHWFLMSIIVKGDWGCFSLPSRTWVSSAANTGNRQRVKPSSCYWAADGWTDGWKGRSWGMERGVTNRPRKQSRRTVYRPPSSSQRAITVLDRKAAAS